MERTVNQELLRTLLAESPVLPAADDLMRLMIQAEMNGMMTEGQQPTDADLLESAGWFFLGAASSPEAEDYYAAGLRRQAFQVAAHLLDLTLRTSPSVEDPLVRARLCFAAQVAYLRGFQQPNAAALLRKMYPSGVEWTGILAQPPLVCLHLGMLFLAGNIRPLRAALREAIQELRVLRERWALPDLTPSWLGASANVVNGLQSMVFFQRNGDREALQHALSLFHLAVTTSRGDSLSKWVASHLLDLSQELERSSPWTVLPPDTPPRVIQAFTHGSPPVLTLWPPQIEFLKGQEGRLFAEDTRRQFLASPTSAGKTLIAQLLIAVHLGRGGKGACFVVPTRSLSTEVSQSLRNRLGDLARVEQSDVLTPDLPFAQEGPAKFLVSVLTPEKLSYLLHRDSQAVLESFDLFIFDEVHNINNSGRGWLLESLITYLHATTITTDHRLMLMSAAVGNDNHFLEWLSGGEVPYSNTNSLQAPWRAPRRLTAVYRTPKGDLRERLPIRGSQDQKLIYPINGVLRTPLFDALGQELTVGEVGHLIQRSSNRQRMTGSTPQYEMVVPLVEGLLRLGLVMAVIQDKRRVQDFALKLAAKLPQIELDSRLLGLIEETRRALGEEHPLVETLQRGVAFHHGEIPTDLRIKIERAAANLLIQCVVCTTSLTEGVNLPVHSVVIVQRYRHDQSGERIHSLTPSQMLNALGRAGRAAIETEGLLVLVAAPDEHSDQPILREASPSPEELIINSVMNDQMALSEFERLEQQIADDETALFSAADDRASDFVSFVWWLAAENEGQVDAVVSALNQSFAAKQVETGRFEVVLNLARRILSVYARTPDAARRRWARSSTSLGTSVQLDRLAQLLGEDVELMWLEGINFVNHLLDIVLDDLLTVREVVRSVGAVRRDWPHRELLRQWIAGEPLQNLQRIIQEEQVTLSNVQGYVYEFIEFTLPWVVSALLERVVLLEGEAIVSQQRIPALTALIRYGLPESSMIPAVRDGKLSRSLAVRLWQAVGGLETTQEGAKEWLDSHEIREWIEILSLTTFELEALMDFISIELNYERVGDTIFTRLDIPEIDTAQPFDVLMQEVLGVPLMALTQNDLLIPVPNQFQSAVGHALTLGFNFTGGFSGLSGLFLYFDEDEELEERRKRQ